jgi:hypothetical protein
VVRLVGRFRQLTSHHVAVLAFPDVTQTPVDRALRRLLRHCYLTRIPRVFGDGEGSHGWIYQLARKGWSFAEKPGSYKKLYKPDWHALMVADMTCDFLTASKDGRFTLQNYGLEVEGSPGGIVIRPDLVVQMETHAEPAVVLVEAETGSQGLKRLNGKCEAYWKASRAYTGTFPLVLFAVPDDEHRRRVRNAMNAGPQGSAELFKVCLATEVVELVEKHLK